MNTVACRESDEELARKARAGSRSAFEELVRRFAPRLCRFLTMKVGSRIEAEDLVQEAFFRIYRNIGRYDDRYRFSTWLYTAASRMAVSHFRSQGRARSQPFNNPGHPEDPCDELIDREQKNRLWNMASRLHPEQYQALWLRYGEDLPVKDVARVMGKKPVTARVLLHRARTELAEKMGEETK